MWKTTQVWTSHLQSENTASPGNPNECLPESSFADSYWKSTVREKVLQTSSHYCPSHIALEGCRHHSLIIAKALYLLPYFLTQPWKIYNYFFLKTDSLNVYIIGVLKLLCSSLWSHLWLSPIHSFSKYHGVFTPSCTLRDVLGYPMVYKTNWCLPHGTCTQAFTKLYWICLHNDGHINSFPLPPFQFSIPVSWTFLVVCVSPCLHYLLHSNLWYTQPIPKYDKASVTHDIYKCKFLDPSPTYWIRRVVGSQESVSFLKLTLGFWCTSSFGSHCLTSLSKAILLAQIFWRNLHCLQKKLTY